MDAEVRDVSTVRIALISDIVAAYVSNNHVAAGDLPNLIATVHAAIGNLTNGGTPAEPEAEKPTPAQIRKSITHDALISFIDGKKYKTIKRHLANHGLTPETYRAQFGLPADYPMVSPSYSQKRSALALSLGLGQRGRGKPPEKSGA